METTISFGYWIRRQRKARDLTQQALADQVGCSLAAIKKIEQDERRPSRQIAELLADALGVRSSQRKIFLEVARGIRSIDQLPLTQELTFSSTPRFEKSVSHNLPIQLTSFIGREKEIAEVIRLLEKARLVTLTGPGGTGKTRLAIQVANRLLDQYPDGVWMVELAPILDPMLVTRTTAIAIGLRDESHRPVIDMLRDYLRAKKMLLLLDNCEHVIEACTHLADTILHACPQIDILATSREALAIAGETLYLVPSLTRPDIRNLPSLETLNQYEAIKLFMDRATSVISTFTLTEENASSIAQICQRLDGIPLAIELAASKIRALSAQQIAQRLEDRFHLLICGSRTALPRHQTLQAAIEWSYNLLSPGEQILFRRLSVFVSGWTLTAAESVCADVDTTKRNSLKAEDILELLTQLVNKSLVMTEERNGEVRYHMLETIRQFGSDKLINANENESLRDQHLEYFLQLAETAAPYLTRPEQLDWLARLDTDYENLRAALEWALGKESAELSLRLCAALGQYWYLRTYWLEGSKWLKNALSKTAQDLTKVEKAARVKALYQDAVLAGEVDDLERMKTSAQQSFLLAQEVSIKKDIAIAGFGVARVLYRRLDYKNALPLFEQSYAEFRELHDAYWEAYCYRWVSHILVAQGKLGEAERSLQYLALARKAGERLNLADALLDYAHSLYSANQIEEAQKYVQEADLVFKQISPNINQTSFLFAELAWSKGDYEEAKHHYMEMQERFGLIGEKTLRSHMIADLGLLTMEQGNLVQAKTYLEEALATAHAVDNKVFIARRLLALGVIYYLQGNMEQCHQSFREGIPLLKELPSGLERFPLLLFVRYIEIHKQEIIARLLGAIDHSAKENERPMSPVVRRYYHQAEGETREKLGTEAFESAFAEGQKMSREEALDLALKTIEEI